jgi:hypothetical protein
MSSRSRHTKAHAPYTLHWSVWESYRMIESEGDLWLIPEGPRVKAYDPADEPSLPSELARVNRPRGRREYRQTLKAARRQKFPVGSVLDQQRVRALLSFMKTFGGLGQTVLDGEPIRIIEDNKSFLADGDRLTWSLRHAENIDCCLWLAGLLRDIEEPTSNTKTASEELRKFFRRWSGARPTGRSHLIATVAPPWFETITVECPPSQASIRQVAEAAQELLASLMTPNLAGVQRTYKWKSGRFEFRALIQLIYWRLADVAGSSSLRQCEECSTYFFCSDPRQRFCPPPAGIRESRCAKRQRMRQWRGPGPRGRGSPGEWR